MEKRSFFKPERVIERGHVTEAFAAVDQVHEGAVPPRCVDTELTQPFPDCMADLSKENNKIIV